MAKLVYALNQSLDGYVDHMAFSPDPTVFRHFIDDVRAVSGSIYGRRMYEVMRYWDDDHPDWDAAERDYAAAWRRQPKWVVSRSLTSGKDSSDAESSTVSSFSRTRPRTRTTVCSRTGSILFR